MLALLLAMTVCAQSPQDPTALAVAVRGDAELTPAAALASARDKVDAHVRDAWRDRAERAAEAVRPFWVPQALADQAVRRWLADLPVAQLVRCVDREDKERDHEFGNSYQTTLWVAEEPQTAQRLASRLRGELRRLEHRTAVRYGGVTAGWIGLVVVLGWIDRLSRGYMTWRLRWLGVLGAAAIPTVAFLV